jgi:hypothetical protein
MSSKKDAEQMEKLREKTDITTVHKRIFSEEGRAIISTFIKKLQESDKTDNVDKLLGELEDVLSDYRLVEIVMATHVVLTDTIRCSVDFENLKVVEKSESETENEKIDNYIR